MHLASHYNYFPTFSLNTSEQLPYPCSLINLQTWPPIIYVLLNYTKEVLIIGFVININDTLFRKLNFIQVSSIP